MIKIEASLTVNGTIALYVEGSNSEESTRDELDLIYQAILSKEPKVGGFTSSNAFSVGVKAAV